MQEIIGYTKWDKKHSRQCGTMQINKYKSGNNKEFTTKKQNELINSLRGG
jgi:hypothetical protein